MTRVRLAPARLALALAFACALVAVMLASGSRLLLPALVCAALSPVLEWTPPARAAKALPRIAGLVLLAVFLVIWFSRPLPLLGPAAGALLHLPAAVLAALATAFALAPASFPPGRTLLPAIVGLLAIAGHDPYAGSALSASRLPSFRSAGYGGLADVYLLLAGTAAIVLWTVELGTSGLRRPRGRLVLLVSTSLGLAALGVVGLPAAQPQLERMVAARLPAGRSGLGAEASLGEFSRLALSRRRLLDLRASRPSARGWRLLAFVLTRFDGRSWTLPVEPRSAPEIQGGSAQGGDARALKAGPSADGGLLVDLGGWFYAGGPATFDRTAPTELRLNQLEVQHWPLLLPRGVLAVTAPLPSLELDRFGLCRRPSGSPVRLYGALVTDEPSAGGLDERERAEALSLPAIDPRVRALAAGLSPSSSPPGERLVATLRHLETGFRYTLTPGTSGADPLAGFLIETRQGYCEHFATAAAVLLRLQGVPTRFVKGLLVGERNGYGDGLYVVRESDAHAWIEAWVEGEGWREVDPTPAGFLTAGEERPGRMARGLERLRAALAEAASRLSSAGPGSLLRWLGGVLADALRVPLVFGLVLALLLAPHLGRPLAALLRQRRQRGAEQAPAVPAELVRLVAEMERAWHRAGRARPAQVGLREHVRAMARPADGAAAATAATGAGVAVLVEASEAIVETYYRARFGGAAPQPGATARLKEALRRSG